MTDFTFNEKTGELTRGGLVATLRQGQPRIFAALSAAPGEFKSTRELCQIANIDDCRVAKCIRSLRVRIAPFGLTIEAQNGRGYRLIVGDMPPKWAPTIPEPAILQEETAPR